MKKFEWFLEWFLNWLLELKCSEIFKLFGLFVIFSLLLCLCIYVLVKFIGIGKISKDGFECNNTNQQFSGYKGWYFGIEPYFRDLLELKISDIRDTNITTKTVETTSPAGTNKVIETVKTQEVSIPFEKLKKYYKAECLTYNALLKRYRLHYFFPFISADTLSEKEIKKIVAEVFF